MTKTKYSNKKSWIKLRMNSSALALILIISFDIFLLQYFLTNNMSAVG
jgi:hypothetical protein